MRETISAKDMPDTAIGYVVVIKQKDGTYRCLYRTRTSCAYQQGRLATAAAFMAPSAEGLGWKEHAGCFHALYTRAQARDLIRIVRIEEGNWLRRAHRGARDADAGSRLPTDDKLVIVRCLLHEPVCGGIDDVGRHTQHMTDQRVQGYKQRVILREVR